MIWGDLHPLEDGEEPPNLGDYSLLAADTLIVDVLKLGLKQAQDMQRSLNMALSSYARNKKWFIEPWLVEKLDPKHLLTFWRKHQLLVRMVIAKF
jgi:hypothetical protein